MQKKCQPRHLPNKLKEFGLPIFESVPHEREHVFAKLSGLLMVILLIYECQPAKNGMPGQRNNKKSRRKV